MLNTLRGYVFQKIKLKKKNETILFLTKNTSLIKR